MGPSCPLGITRCVPQENVLFFTPHANPLLPILFDQDCCLLASINIQLSCPRALSITHMHFTTLQLNCLRLNDQTLEYIISSTACSSVIMIFSLLNSFFFYSTRSFAYLLILLSRSICGYNCFANLLAFNK